MRGRTPKAIAAGAAAIALFAAGCTAKPADQPPGDTDSGGGTLRVYASEPAFLVPTAADDDPSIQIIHTLYRGLVSYNNDTGKPENDLAESITSTDNTTWTIKIKQGNTFTNGEPVNADAFIRSWNYTAAGANAQNNAYFMSRIKGAEEMADAKSTVKELSGVKKIDEYTLTVELTAPFVGFPAIVGYSGFYPVAKACLDDFKACNETPIGNGQYKIEGSWNHNIGITVVRNPDYKGTPGKADKIEFKIYADVDSGYAGFQSDEIDVMYTLPNARVAEAKQQNPDGFFERPSDSFTYVGLPQYLDAFKDKRVRQALSMAIDRKAIIDAVFDGRFTPATGVVSPNFDGFRPNVCQYCVYDPAKAKQLLADAGGWKGGKITLWANGGADHEKWLQAVGDDLKRNLGIDYELNTSLTDFGAYLDTVGKKKVTGPYRLGWGPDYPVIETYLAPLYGTGGSSNDSGFSNKQFDDLIKQGDGAASLDEGIKSYQQAEDIVVEEMPVIPLWFGKVSAVYGANVDKFVFNNIWGRPNYADISVKPAA